MRWLTRCAAVLAFIGIGYGAVPGGAVHAAPRVPASDGEIVETLPALASWSRGERQLRRELVARPRDAGVAIEAAQTYLEVARTQGDARYAGYAMGVLQAWQPMTAATPPAILVMHATVAQFLHDFQGAEASLKLALAREPGNAQAWITLATLLRVGGRYADSDAACRSLGRVGPTLYGVACLAENAGLRGEHKPARQALQDLLASPAVRDPTQGGTRQWLWTSIAEVEQLTGDAQAADKAYRQALAEDRSGYTLLAYADFLLDNQRAAEVLPLLRKEPRSDAVVLRLAMAAARVNAAAPSPQAAGAAAREADELRQRFAAAALRPGATAVHAREQAMFALEVERDAAAALTLARSNVRLQREPIDVLLFARAAAAAKDEVARREVLALMQNMGLRDARVDEIL